MTSYASARSANSVTQRFVDTVSEEGTFKYVPFNLGKNQIAQLTLDCPDDPNLDYDLMLYTIDSDGSLIEMVEYSDLTTSINSNGETLDESIGYLYTGDELQSFAVLVYARVGGSTTKTFALTVSLDLMSNLDAYEINDSPYYPCNFTPSGSLTISPNFNVVNDQDWFYFETNSYDTLTVPTSTDYQVEVYQANGAAMRLLPSSTANGMQTIDLADGGNYIRIFSGREANDPGFSYAPFQLSLNFKDSTPTSPVEPFRFGVVFDGDEGPNAYVNYGPYTNDPKTFDRKYRYKDTLTPTVTVKDAYGNPVVGVQVTVRLVSSFWSEASGLHEQFYTSDTVTDAQGRVTFSIKPPAAGGAYGILLNDGPHVYRHYVDIDELYFYVDGMRDFGEEVTSVYRFACSEFISS